MKSMTWFHQINEIPTNLPTQGCKVFDKGVFTPNDQHHVSWHWASEIDVGTFRLTVRRKLAHLHTAARPGGPVGQRVDEQRALGRPDAPGAPPWRQSIFSTRPRRCRAAAGRPR